MTLEEKCELAVKLCKNRNLHKHTAKMWFEYFEFTGEFREEKLKNNDGYYKMARILWDIHIGVYDTKLAKVLE